MDIKTHLKVLGAIACFIGAVVLGVKALPVLLAIVAALFFALFFALIYAWLYLIFSDQA